MCGLVCVYNKNLFHSLSERRCHKLFSFFFFSFQNCLTHSISTTLLFVSLLVLLKKWRPLVKPWQHSNHKLVYNLSPWQHNQWVGKKTNNATIVLTLTLNPFYLANNFNPVICSCFFCTTSDSAATQYCVIRHERVKLVVSALTF